MLLYQQCIQKNSQFFYKLFEGENPQFENHILEKT